MEVAVPAIVSAVVGTSVNKIMNPTPKAPPPPPTLTWEQARQQAQDVLNPLYDQQLKNTLQNVDHQSIARGFYGQMPADAFRGARAADIETARSGQIGSLANQMQGQTYQQALQAQQLAAQQALAQQQMGMGAFGQGLQSALGYYDRTWEWPFQKQGDLTTKQTYNLAMNQIKQGLPGYDALSTYKPQVTNKYGLGLNASWSNPFKW